MDRARRRQDHGQGGPGLSGRSSAGFGRQHVDVNCRHPGGFGRFVCSGALARSNDGGSPGLWAADQWQGKRRAS